MHSLRNSTSTIAKFKGNIILAKKCRFVNIFIVIYRKITFLKKIFKE